MVCKKCGASLSNDLATCPLCGALMTKEQLATYVEIKKEKAKDLRPKLISEQYGMEPIKYEQKQNQINDKLILILVICGVIVILFLIVLLILF